MSRSLTFNAWFAEVLRTVAGSSPTCNLEIFARGNANNVVHLNLASSMALAIAIAEGGSLCEQSRRIEKDLQHRLDAIVGPYQSVRPCCRVLSRPARAGKPAELWRSATVTVPGEWLADALDRLPEVWEFADIRCERIPHGLLRYRCWIAQAAAKTPVENGQSCFC